MAVLTEAITLEEETWKGLERQAEEEKSTRAELVDKAIRIYLREKAWENLQDLGREMREKGITEEDINEAFKEVREERKHRKRGKT